VRPADGFARGGDFRLAERRAVAIVGAGLGRSTLADDSLAADQCRLLGLLLGLADGVVDGLDVVPVDILDHVPAVGAETGRRIVGEPALDVAVDGNAVVVIEDDQLAELPGSGKGACFVADAFHQAAVANERVGVVVDDGETVAVEFGGQQLFGERQADGVGQALAERSGTGFDARGIADFRVARGHAVQLPETLELLDRQGIAGEMQQAVQQHRAVAVGEHEAVAVRPVRIDWVVFQVPGPQGHGDLGHAQGHAGMSGTGRLHGIHGQSPDGVGAGVEVGHDDRFR